MKAHVSDKKKKEVKEIINLFKKYKTISLGDLTSLPSKQLQAIRDRLKKDLFIKTSKKRLIRLAIKDFKDKDLSGLNNNLDSIMPVLLLSNEDPFNIYSKLKKNKVNLAAKPGQIAPYDLEIKAGPTNFTPGPIIGELGQVGLVAAVEGGKIVIKRDKVIAKEGDVITGKVADILSKMGIEPMEVKLNMVVSYEDGMVYDKETLDIDEGKLLLDIKLAHISAINLAVKAVYPCDDTIKKLIAKASLEANALDGKLDLEEPPLEKNVREENKEEPKVKEEIKEEVKEEEPSLEKNVHEENLLEKDSAKEENNEELKSEVKEEHFLEKNVHEKIEEVKEKLKEEEKVEEKKSDEEVAKGVLEKLKDDDIKQKEEIKKEEKKVKTPTAHELVEAKKQEKKKDKKVPTAHELIEAKNGN